MGDPNQFAYVRSLLDVLEGPVLEVGSKDYGSTEDLRPLFADKGAYVGVDLESGPGVDIALDLTRDFAEVDAALGGQRFGTIICLSVLEHCEQPFRMAENITRLLKPGGSVCLSAPFAWKFHGYPSDYWRFTHEGIRKLFPTLSFSDEHCGSATSRKGSFRPLDTELGRINLGSKSYRRRGEWLQSLSVGVVSGLSRLGVLRWLGGYHYVMAPTNVLMVGTRAA